MLIGQYEHTIDIKKRLALPAKFRGELGDKVIVTKGIESCLVVYTEKEFLIISEKLSNLTLTQPEARSFTRTMLASAMEVTLDKLGRILLPDYLKKYAGLNKNVVICGLSNKLEIWDSESWSAWTKEAEKGVSDIVSKLGGLGIYIMIHTAVLKKEVLEYLDPKQNENFVDCTIGEGGHSEEILRKNGPEGKVLGIDLDPQQIVASQWLHVQFKDRIVLVNDSYSNLLEIAQRKNFEKVSGILLDLGMSSAQLVRAHKGFSFQVDQGLDMRYNDESAYLTAEKIVNEWSEEKIEEILENYGEEKFAKKIARNIVEQRKLGRIKSTFQLIEIIKDATPSVYWRGKIHYATRTFQAIRIAVNDELENIKRVLPDAVSLLAPEGKLVVISFHSLEDRIIKNFFASESKNGKLKILTKKPITASRDELGKNPRARSAKLRVAVKI